jgi:Domain of unknown function (DUF3291)
MNGFEIAQLNVGRAVAPLVNLSVWSSIDALYDFTYRSDHKTVLKRRHEWFERLGRPNTVPWCPPDAGDLQLSVARA